MSTSKVKEEGYKEELDKYQGENEKLRDELTEKSNVSKQTDTKQREQIESFERLLSDKVKEAEDLKVEIASMKKQQSALEQSQYDHSAKANSMQFDLKRNIENITFKLKETEKKNNELRSKVDQYKYNDKEIRKSNRKYRDRLTEIRSVCRNLRAEIRNQQNELSFVKSSFSMFMERISHEMTVSFNQIQTKSAKCILKKESGIQQQLNRSIKQLERNQDFKIKSIENQVQSVLIRNARKQREVEDKSNMRSLDITGLENEMDTIRNQLGQAKSALSPRKIQFKKISAGSLDSSIAMTKPRSNGRKFKLPPTPVPAVNQKVIAKPTKFVDKDPFETSAIARLRNDLQSLETNYKHKKKVNKQRFKSVSGHSLDSSASVI